MAVEIESQFPDNFLFGAATAGHQVGDNLRGGSDWNEFERKNAGNLALEATGEKDYGNGPLPPETWEKVRRHAKDPLNYISGEASGWWKGHWREDLDIAQDLGIKAIRFSIERAQTQPATGQELDPEAIRHYREFIKACRERNIEPVATLFHFVNPQWFAEGGGWPNSDLARDFPRYVRDLIRAIDGEVSYYTPINEPEVYVFEGWLMGEWPPQRINDLKGALRVRKNLIDAHKRTFDVIKEEYGDDQTQVSAAINLTYNEPKTSRLTDRLGSAIANKLTNGMFLPQMVSHMDFVGINHYMHNVKSGINPQAGVFQNEGELRSDLGWYLNPESLYEVIMATARKYKKPVIVTEHGLADAEDRYRPQFIREGLGQILRAIQDGAVVLGYMHWALIDNYEWDKGFWPRFGLIAVDYQTQERRARESAREYSGIIKARSL